MTSSLYQLVAVMGPGTDTSSSPELQKEAKKPRLADEAMTHVFTLSHLYLPCSRPVSTEPKGTNSLAHGSKHPM